MINNSLPAFIARVTETKRISAEDVKDLQTTFLPEGIGCREEAEALLALDRTAAAVPGWGDFLVAALVEFAVWTSRPTGYVDDASALWLVAALGSGGEPTANATRAAFEIVKEAEQADEALLGFVMRVAQGGWRGADRAAFDLAA